MIHNKKQVGCFKDPRDKRDMLLSACETPVSAIKLPLAVFNEPNKIYSQRFGSCTGWSAATLGTIIEDYEKNNKQWSGRAQYALNKKEDGIPKEQGSYTRVAMKNLNKYGLFLDKDLQNDPVPWEVYKDFNLIPEESYKVAQKHKIANYASVDYDIRQAIYKKKGAALSIPWYEGSYKAADTNGIIHNTGKKYGGHSICCCGYITVSKEDWFKYMNGEKDMRPLFDKVRNEKEILGEEPADARHFLILANSHGAKYGWDGFALYPDSAELWNKWAVVSLPNDWQDPPANHKYNKHKDDWDLMKVLEFNVWIWLLGKLRRFPTKKEFYKLTAGNWAYEEVFDKNNKAHIYTDWMPKAKYLSLVDKHLTGSLSDINVLRDKGLFTH